MYMNSIEDLIWKELDSTRIVRDGSVDAHLHEEKFTECRNCTGKDINMNDEEYICNDCGLVLNRDCINTGSTFEVSQPVVYSSKFSFTNNKISRMQEWYMWTNDEKNIYKLKVYVRDLCKRLGVVECLVESIADTVVMVMDCIKRNDGTKRARVKDGIIVACIYYVSKDTSTPYSYMHMAKGLKLDIKYVTKADKMILELINTKKLQMDKANVLQTLKPYDYVINIVNKRNIRVDKALLKRVKTLIEICDDNDILLDHTPLSIGVCCFYYILQLQSVEIDLKIFCELYDLSVVTVIKTYNKLKVYEDRINQMISEA